MIYKGKIYKMVIIPNPVGSGMVQIYDQITGLVRLDHDGAAMATVSDKLDDRPYNTKVVPAPVREAFLNGSMFGWDCDGANPYYCLGKEL